jgi:hypothetical protein
MGRLLCRYSLDGKAREWAGDLACSLDSKSMASGLLVIFQSSVQVWLMISLVLVGLLSTFFCILCFPLFSRADCRAGTVWMARQWLPMFDGFWARCESGRLVFSGLCCSFGVLSFSCPCRPPFYKFQEANCHADTVWTARHWLPVLGWLTGSWFPAFVAALAS